MKLLKILEITLKPITMRFHNTTKQILDFIKDKSIDIDEMRAINRSLTFDNHIDLLSLKRALDWYIKKDVKPKKVDKGKLTPFAEDFPKLENKKAYVPKSKPPKTSGLNDNDLSDQAKEWDDNTPVTEMPYKHVSIYKFREEERAVLLLRGIQTTKSFRELFHERIRNMKTMDISITIGTHYKMFDNINNGYAVQRGAYEVEMPVNLSEEDKYKLAAYTLRDHVILQSGETLIAISFKYIYLKKNNIKNPTKWVL